MNNLKRFSFLTLLVAVCLSGCVSVTEPTAQANMSAEQVKTIPKSWIDADTGHKVVRLSEEDSSRSLYFHQNSYAASGDKMVISVDNPRGVAVVDLNTLKVKRIFEDPDVGILFMGPKGRDVYLTHIPSVNGQVVHPQNELQTPTKILAVNIDTGAVRDVATVARGKIHSINNDETLLIGAFAEQAHSLETGPRDKRFEARYEAKDADGNPLSFADAKEVRMDERLESRIPMQMFTVNIKTGEQKIIMKSTDWLNHIQFSPSDPELVMYSHEGPWHKVDRIWITDIHGKTPQKIHQRMMNMEIAGHEFFSFDGKHIFYDLQTPRGQDFWLASYNLETGERVWRHMERDEWSVHFNISRDGKLFAGDGGDDEMVAKAKDGKWIYLFESEPVKDVAGIHARNAKDLIKPAVLKSQKLVNMKDHDYRLEPNITFTPDGKWLVFRSNMHGPVHVYAVEIAKHAN
ncbi:oligogalacturonate lyase family protein [Pseudoalteromonas prydzensis]|uniref:PD40 domain-containing protein n=1 Tax=Pseudoalteromonas prydzensis TaxID=182141 RepID=A0ABR9FSX1_9GAMM|nr:oligogalacturonate lyase family protein [Pseudoalteromonas prydzensis]MBE0459925.1 PD40 domain-containing protein [Pseudoalteromonas prydzensis]